MTTSTDRVVLVLVSPNAGRGQHRDQLNRLERLCGDRGWRHQQTSDVQDLKAALVDAPAAVVVAAGGDGTLTLVANFLDEFPRAVLLPLPMGTENLLARRLGYPVDAAAIADAIAANQVAPIDAMWCTIGRRRRWALVMATAGFDAAVVRRVHLRRRGHINRWTYALPIATSVLRYPFTEIRVTTEDQQVDCRWAMVFNMGAYGGDLPILPSAAADDGWLDVLCFAGGGLLNGLRYFGGILAGRHERFRDVTRLRTRRVELTSESRVPLQCDGDYAGRLPATLVCRPGRVRLLAPFYTDASEAPRFDGSTQEIQ